MEGIGIVLFGFGGYIYGKFSRNKLNGPGILTFPNGNIHACSNWKAGKLSEKYIKYNHEDKTWKYSRYLYTVQLEETNEKNNIHKEFSQIKEDILQKSEIPFEYKVIKILKKCLSLIFFRNIFSLFHSRNFIKIK